MRRLLALVAFTVAPVLGARVIAPVQDDERYALVVDRSMAGVELEMTKDEVREILGSPTESRRADDDFGRVQRWYFKGPQGALLLPQGGCRRAGRDRDVHRRGFVRGPSNSGVGTPESALRERIDGLTCETFTAPGFKQRSCYTGDFSPGDVVTDFGMFSLSVLPECPYGAPKQDATSRACTAALKRAPSSFGAPPGPGHH